MGARDLYTVDVPFISGTKKIAFTANALVAAEKEIGCQILELLGRDNASKRIGFIELRALLWAGLRAVRGRSSGPEWSLEKVGDEMDTTRTAEYLLAAVRAVSIALNGNQEQKQPEGEDPTKGTGQQASTGTVSE